MVLLDDRFEVITLELADLAQVLVIENSSYSNPWSEGLLLAEFTREDSLRPALRRGAQLVAQSFSRVVSGELHILNLAVHPGFRRCRLGASLLATILTQAANCGCVSASLEVRVSNFPAQQMYLQAGFVQVGRRRAYYADNHEDALLFERRLNLDQLDHRAEKG